MIGKELVTRNSPFNSDVPIVASFKHRADGKPIVDFAIGKRNSNENRALALRDVNAL